MEREEIISMASAERVETLENKRYGIVFLINNLKGYKNDVEKISNLFMKMGYKIILSREIASLQELEQKVLSIEKKPHTDMIVFFFGYGFEDFVYINREGNECVSYRQFCNLFNIKQTNEESIVVFTNCYFKCRTPETVKIPDSDIITENTFHLKIKVNGECEEGSLLTEALLEIFEQNKELGFHHLATGIASTIRMLQEKHDQKNIYITDIWYYGITKDFFFEKLSSLDTVAV